MTNIIKEVTTQANKADTVKGCFLGTNQEQIKKINNIKMKVVISIRSVSPTNKQRDKTIRIQCGIENISRLIKT